MKSLRRENYFAEIYGTAALATSNSRNNDEKNKKSLIVIIMQIVGSLRGPFGKYPVIVTSIIVRVICSLLRSPFVPVKFPFVIVPIKTACY